MRNLLRSIIVTPCGTLGEFGDESPYRKKVYTFDSLQERMQKLEIPQNQKETFLDQSRIFGLTKKRYNVMGRQIDLLADNGLKGKNLVDAFNLYILEYNRQKFLG